jgi:hypothetical protein
MLNYLAFVADFLQSHYDTVVQLPSRVFPLRAVYCAWGDMHFGDSIEIRRYAALWSKLDWENWFALAALLCFITYVILSLTGEYLNPDHFILDIIPLSHL